MAEICKTTGIDNKDISGHLNNLINLGYIEKLKPIDIQSKGRTTQYRLCDPFLRFWFRYVY